MLSDAELGAMLQSRESSRIERKEVFVSDEVKKTACAFANDLGDSGKPGIIFIGARNDGTCADLTITDNLLLKIGEIRADGSLLPPPVIEIDEREVSGCQLVVVQVYPHHAPPIRYKGKAFIRIGPRNQAASPEEERILSERRRARDLPFDYRSIDSSSLEDVDLFRFRERYLPRAVSADVLAENERDDRHRMLSLRLLDSKGFPTAGGLLITGKNPEAFLPGAYIQFNRFDGEELTDPIIDTKRISGTLDEQLSAIDDLLKLNIRSGVSFVNRDQELRSSDYPVAALQQLARNAVMHRNYESNAPTRISWFSNRVQIQNPGGLFGQVDESNFGLGATDYRNPLVAEGMSVYGFAQKFGVGVPTARKLLKVNGNPQPSFEFGPSSFAVIVRAT